MCTKNHNHMMYGSWGTEWHRQNFLSYWTIFCLFTPLTIHKMKILKKWKKNNNWGFYWFTLKHHKWQSYHVWFLKHGGQQRALFCHQKQTNFNIYQATLKKNENPRDIIFYTCIPVPEIKSLTDWNW